MLGKVSQVAALAFLFVVALAPGALGAVIYAGQDQARLDMATGRSYSAAIAQTGVYDDRLGSVSLIDDGNWILGAWHVIDDGYSSLSVMFGESVFDAPTEIVDVDMNQIYPLAGYDAFIARLVSTPTTADPIQRLRDSIAIGDEGFFSGYGDLYIAGQGYVTEDGQRRTGHYRIDGNWSGTEVYSILYPSGHPWFDIDDQGGAPGDSGGSVAFLDAFGEPALGSMVTSVTGYGFNSTISLRLEAINGQIDAIIPEPATALTLLLGTSVLLIGRRRRSA